jgi:hypothetical protein
VGRIGISTRRVIGFRGQRCPWSAVNAPLEPWAALFGVIGTAAATPVLAWGVFLSIGNGSG